MSRSLCASGDRLLPAMRVFSAILALGLAACGTGIETDATYADKTKEEMYKHGSVASEQGGFSLLGGSADKKKEISGIGVNGFLWRATLDTIAFMPIASADPFGGLITTDWFTNPAAPDERVKLNVLVLDRDLRADGVKVSVFRQTRANEDKDWADAPVSPSTASALEESILTRARQLRLAQKEGR